MSEPWGEAHRAAVRAGARGYRDPSTGFFVMTELAHLERGSCCGSGCRHCPYHHEEVPAELRARVPRPVTVQGER